MKIHALSVSLGFRAQLRLGLVIALWLVVFLVLIGPFDGADLSLSLRAQLMPPYGVIFLLAYLSVIWLQRHLYRWLGYWDLLVYHPLHLRPRLKIRYTKL